jgi:hypothetical protein
MAAPTGEYSLFMEACAKLRGAFTASRTAAALKVRANLCNLIRISSFLRAWLVKVGAREPEQNFSSFGLQQFQTRYAPKPPALCAATIKKSAASNKS